MNLLDKEKNDLFSRDVFEINLAYLLMAQKLLAFDFKQGLVRTGMSRSQGEALLSLKSKTLVEAARSTNLIVSLRDCNFFNVLDKTQKFTSPVQQAFLSISSHAATGARAE